MGKQDPSVVRYDPVWKCFIRGMWGPWEGHLLWDLRDHFMKDEWEFIRQRMARILRQRKQHV